MNTSVILERSDAPDEVREMRIGRFEWVVGDEPYVSLRFFGANQYAR